MARALLGKYLVRMYGDKPLVCRITETEAYIGRCDRACHAYDYRRTARTETMFGPPGHAYIYLIYGLHHCLNLVTEPAGEPSAVLLRGGELVSGLETICRLRYDCSPAELTAYRRKNLLNGPGKLCKALGLSKKENGMDLTGDTLFVCEDPADLGLPGAPGVPGTEQLCCGPRIGVDYAGADALLPWRFWLEKGAEHR